MPRSNREYLKRYAEQAMNDIERGLERLKMLSEAYGGNYKPMGDDSPPILQDEPENYDGQHGKYQQFVDMIAAQIIGAYKDLITFREKFM